MSRQDHAAAMIDGRLNSRNVHIGVARADHNNGLRRYRRGEGGDRADHRNQSY
jgi:hypothetical protein